MTISQGRATTKMILAICALFPAVVAGKGGCVAVPKDKCGDQWFNSCLKCGTASSFDCEECCPGCKLVSKAPYYYCQCGAPKPGPSPGPAPFPPGGDSWQRYTVDGMDVIAVTGGKDKDAYDKVVVLLHGGGGNGEDWEYQPVDVCIYRSSAAVSRFSFARLFLTGTRRAGSAT